MSLPECSIQYVVQQMSHHLFRLQMLLVPGVEMKMQQGCVRCCVLCWATAVTQQRKQAPPSCLGYSYLDVEREHRRTICWWRRGGKMKWVLVGEVEEQKAQFAGVPAETRSEAVAEAAVVLNFLV